MKDLLRRRVILTTPLPMTGVADCLGSDSAPRMWAGCGRDLAGTSHVRMYRTKKQIEKRRREHLGPSRENRRAKAPLRSAPHVSEKATLNIVAGNQVIVGMDVAMGAAIALEERAPAQTEVARQRPLRAHAEPC